MTDTHNTERLYAHGIVQVARGMCMDEEPYPAIDAKLAEAVDRVKDVEGERDALTARVDTLTERAVERYRGEALYEEALARVDTLEAALREANEAITAVAGRCNYYFGPGGRAAVGPESVAEYRALIAARDRARSLASAVPAKEES
jgi:hypothetical protein